MGPGEPRYTGEADPGLCWAECGLDLKAAIVCETPSAKINCSLNSILVLPLAGYFVFETDHHHCHFHHGQNMIDCSGYVDEF